MLTKPVDLARLCRTVRDELTRREGLRRRDRRHRRLRELARNAGRHRRRGEHALASACADLTASCRDLHGQIQRQQALIAYQRDLLACRNEDEIFRHFFQLFAQRTGPLFGVAMLCDDEAELQVVGRFGVPGPDGPNFSRSLALAVVPTVLTRPEVAVLDATDNQHIFPTAISTMLTGLTLLVVPLLVDEGQLIGIGVLYRKGEQPFTADDVALAHLAAGPTAKAVEKA
jgi:GAF domain-containing protein